MMGKTSNTSSYEVITAWSSAKDDIGERRYAERHHGEDRSKVLMAISERSLVSSDAEIKFGRS